MFVATLAVLGQTCDLSSKRGAEAMLSEYQLYTLTVLVRAEGVLEHPLHPPGYTTDYGTCGESRITMDLKSHTNTCKVNSEQSEVYTR